MKVLISFVLASLFVLVRISTATQGPEFVQRSPFYYPYGTGYPYPYLNPYYYPWGYGSRGSFGAPRSENVQIPYFVRIPYYVPTPYYYISRQSDSNSSSQNQGVNPYYSENTPSSSIVNSGLTLGSGIKSSSENVGPKPITNICGLQTDGSGNGGPKDVNFTSCGQNLLTEYLKKLRR